MGQSVFEVFGRIFSYFVTTLSLIVLIYTSTPVSPDSRTWHTLAIVAAIIFGLFLVILDVIGYFRYRPRSYRKADKIEKYMHKWISQEGQVAILTRDMSWAQNDRTAALLTKKAKKDELLLYIQRQIPLSEKLEQEGARIYTYESLGYQMDSRFTIVRKGRMDARVAIGYKPDGRSHLIEEFSTGSDPAYHLAKDLVEIIERLPATKTA